jgi:hypothetical protein
MVDFYYAFTFAGKKVPRESQINGGAIPTKHRGNCDSIILWRSFTL